jgi:hypothetical protein
MYQMFKHIKSIFDDKKIMNPGKKIPWIIFYECG